MNRRQLAFTVLINALVSLVIALGVMLIFERRRPDPDELAAINSSPPQAILAQPAVTPSAITSGIPAAPTPVTLPQVQETAAVAPVTPGEGEIVYTVQAGDSLLAIATRYNVTVDDLVQTNNLANPDFVFSGQQLVIPVPNGAAAAGQNVDGVDSATPEAGDQTGVQVLAVENSGDLTNEAILVVNESNTPVSLQDWTLAREDGPIYRFGDVPLFPGGSIRVYSASGADSSIDLYWGQPAAVWQSGAVVQLVNAQSAPVSTYTVP